MVRPTGPERLFEAVKALKREAHSRGLTDDIIDEELAAYNAERRDAPPRCVIVFDVSALVGAAIRRDGVPELALRRAIRRDQVAVSEAVIAELLDVFARPQLQRFLNPELLD